MMEYASNKLLYFFITLFWSDLDWYETPGFSTKSADNLFRWCFTKYFC